MGGLFEDCYLRNSGFRVWLADWLASLSVGKFSESVSVNADIFPYTRPPPPNSEFKVHVKCICMLKILNIGVKFVACI